MYLFISQLFICEMVSPLGPICLELSTWSLNCWSSNLYYIRVLVLWGTGDRTKNFLHARWALYQLTCKNSWGWVELLKLSSTNQFSLSLIKSGAIPQSWLLIIDFPHAARVLPGSSSQPPLPSHFMQVLWGDEFKNMDSQDWKERKRDGAECTGENGKTKDIEAIQVHSWSRERTWQYWIEPVLSLLLEFLFPMLGEEERRGHGWMQAASIVFLPSEPQGGQHWQQANVWHSRGHFDSAPWYPPLDSN